MTGFRVYAPINLKPAGGGRQGMGWGFDIFQKFAVKFPTRGQTIPVKCTKNFPTPGGILLSIIPRLDARKTQGKQGNSIIFTTSQHYYVSKIQLRLIHCVYRITKSTESLISSSYFLQRLQKA